MAFATWVAVANRTHFDIVADAERPAASGNGRRGHAVAATRPSSEPRSSEPFGRATSGMFGLEGRISCLGEADVDAPGGTWCGEDRRDNAGDQERLKQLHWISSVVAASTKDTARYPDRRNLYHT